MGFFKSSSSSKANKLTKEEQLYDAAQSGDARQVKHLLSLGASVAKAAKQDIGWTCLHAAASKQHAECLEALLAAKDAKTAINAGDHDAVTALHLAASRGNVTCIQLLIRAGAEPNMRTKLDGWSPLHSALMFEYKDAARALLVGGAEANALSEEGLSPLHLAAGKGDVECIKLMLEKGADINIQDKAGESAVDRAFAREQGDAVRLLVESGASKCKLIDAFLTGTHPNSVQNAPPSGTKNIAANVATEAHAIVAKYPNRVPVVLTRRPGCELADVKQSKFLTPNSLTIEEFISNVLKKNAEIGESTTVFVHAGKVTLNSGMKLSAAYSQFQDPSGYLFLSYSSKPMEVSNKSVSSKITTFEHKATNS